VTSVGQLLGQRIREAPSASRVPGVPNLGSLLDLLNDFDHDAASSVVNPVYKRL
jgi:hypothetical protein